MWRFIRPAMLVARAFQKLLVIRRGFGFIGFGALTCVALASPPGCLWVCDLYASGYLRGWADKRHVRPEARMLHKLQCMSVVCAGLRPVTLVAVVA